MAKALSRTRTTKRRESKPAAKPKALEFIESFESYEAALLAVQGAIESHFADEASNAVGPLLAALDEAVQRAAALDAEMS